VCSGEVFTQHRLLLYVVLEWGNIYATSTAHRPPITSQMAVVCRRGMIQMNATIYFAHK